MLVSVPAIALSAFAPTAPTAPVDRPPAVSVASIDAADIENWIPGNRPDAPISDATLLGTFPASYYGDGFAGKPTANGEMFDPSKLTAAHRTLPFGTMVEVRNEATGKTVVVRINDRGPFHGDRAIDLSEQAARQIGMAASGTANVTLHRLG